MSSADYVCHAEFMWYAGHFTPRHLFFVSVYDTSYQLCVKVTDATLKAFTYSDIQTNLLLPHNPFQSSRLPDIVHEVSIDQLIPFVQHHLMPDLLNASGWASTVGTMDTATYLFLRPLLDEVVLLGVQLMDEKVDMLTSSPNCWEVCAVAAEKLFLQRQKGPNPYWVDV